jgi:hypothetical protein
MPALADITVKKADETTNIVWTGTQPASGDNPAIWKSKTVGTAYEHQPEARFVSREGNKGRSRTVRVTGVYPQIATNSTTGVTSVVNRLRLVGAEWDIPKGMTATDIAEAVHQLCNLMASTLAKAMVKEGQAAT